MTLEERKKNLEVLLQQKIQQLQKIEESRNVLTTEIFELKGKLNLIAELLKEKIEEQPAK